MSKSKEYSFDKNPLQSGKKSNEQHTLAMAARMGMVAVFLVVMLAGRCIAADPDPVQDFCVRDTNATRQGQCKVEVTGDDFKTSMLAKAGNNSNPLGTALTLATAASFPALSMQGISMGRIDVAVNGVVQPHTHPRASESIFVADGTLHAGFVDTQNRLYLTKLRRGDLFVVPRGLVHFFENVGDHHAVLIIAFNSENPGASLIAPNLLSTDISDQVLAKSFRTTPQLVRSLRASFQPTPTHG